MSSCDQYRRKVSEIGRLIKSTPDLYSKAEIITCLEGGQILSFFVINMTMLQPTTFDLFIPVQFKYIFF